MSGPQQAVILKRFPKRLPENALSFSGCSRELVVLRGRRSGSRP